VGLSGPDYSPIRTPTACRGEPVGKAATLRLAAIGEKLT